ncbi:MAG: histidine kinase [Bacteroidetes bacterium]|jgi:hypothetical protein|nr:histidine kinase [Bacteroidota bacterium]
MMPNWNIDWLKPQRHISWIRWLSLLIFALLVPSLSGFIAYGIFSAQGYVLLYGWCFLYAAFVWELNLRLLRWLLAHEPRSEQRTWRMVRWLLAHSVLTAALSVGGVALTCWLFTIPYVWDIQQRNLLFLIPSVLVVGHYYETAFHLSKTQELALKQAQLAQASSEARLQALMQQVDPHFLFNSLNVLLQLMEEDVARAEDFVQHLSQLYRYVLEHGKQPLVLLEEELGILAHYEALMQLRFGHSFRLEYTLQLNPNGYLIPPTSLLTLAENALKHNRLSSESALCVQVRESHSGQQRWLEVENEIRTKNQPDYSTRLGLENLRGRYLLATRQLIEVRASATHFLVRLPLVEVYR